MSENQETPEDVRATLIDGFGFSADDVDEAIREEGANLDACINYIAGKHTRAAFPEHAKEPPRQASGTAPSVASAPSVPSAPPPGKQLSGYAADTKPETAAAALATMPANPEAARIQQGKQLMEMREEMKARTRVLEAEREVAARKEQKNIKTAIADRIRMEELARKNEYARQAELRRQRHAEEERAITAGILPAHAPAPAPLGSDEIVIEPVPAPLQRSADEIKVKARWPEGSVKVVVVSPDCSLSNLWDRMELFDTETLFDLSRGVSLAKDESGRTLRDCGYTSSVMFSVKSN